MTSNHQEKASPAIILIAGHWLGAWAWDEVVEQLTSDGMRAIPITLPGLDVHDSQRATRTLDDQIAAIQSVVDAQGGDVVLVAHSGANAPVSVVIDRNPELIRRVVWVDSGPVSPGSTFAPDLPESVVEVPLPAFDALGEQASLDGLSSEHLHRFREKAVAEPAAVIRATVELTNVDRLTVPTTLVCCSMSSEQILELAQGGHPMFTEVSKLTNVDVIDLPTGHWPMWSCPYALAKVISNTALR
ncbi:alpha/beta hydrolase [Corynebacterium canis]|uniref:Alpha/beta hydrolase n=1 Tax=Corynebacterium canis TaxID=679663 RepID=A0A5C5USW7_9CORY|nr:alpha/beta hydrolase [Corynebacterium canis]TWT28702.1 alpha/beta hydrolase [Corynebacterium canis]WJY75726.1 Alpha/beta hydrolase family protein [Corynebacterium canis]